MSKCYGKLQPNTSITINTVVKLESFELGVTLFKELSRTYMTYPFKGELSCRNKYAHQ